MPTTGTLVTQARITLAQRLTAWLSTKDNLTPLSRQLYAEIIGQHITPTLGETELQKLVLKLVPVKAGRPVINRDSLRKKPRGFPTNRDMR
jgi:hypothetical protein